MRHGIVWPILSVWTNLLNLERFRMTARMCRGESRAVTGKNEVVTTE
jgi:hypothetical protein